MPRSSCSTKRYRAEVVPALVGLLRTGEVVPWLGPDLRYVGGGRATRAQLTCPSGTCPERGRCRFHRDGDRHAVEELTALHEALVAVWGYRFGVTEGIHGWLTNAARLDRLDLPRYEPTFAALADVWRRAVGSTDEWQQVSLSFVRTVATIAAAVGRGLLWGNDVCPDVWRESLGLSEACFPPAVG